MICQYEYASDKTKQNPGVLSFVSQKNRTAVSVNLLLNSISSLIYYRETLITNSIRVSFIFN